MTPQTATALHTASAKLLQEYEAWAARGFYAPSPHFIKQICLLRNGYPNGTWVETGTYLGQTTAILAGSGSKVYSIEPEPTLFANAEKAFSKLGNVKILNGISEQVFPILLPRIYGDVNFWLDGHYSAGVTFKGPQDTPIRDELKHIALHLSHFNNVCVLVDDIRLFRPHLAEFAGYPTIDFLVDWARQHKLHWHIEHDIFVARTGPSP